MRLSNNSLKLLLIACMVVVVIAILFVVGGTPRDVVATPTLSVNQTSLPQPKNQSTVASDSHAHSVNNQAPITQADIRYQKLVTLMSSSMSEMSQTEQNAAIEQILAELPLVVRDGKMSPNDAMFAHSVLLERQNVVIDEAMMQDIQRKYVSLYPNDASARSELHLD